MWNLNGSITTPWFGEEYVEEYYKEDKDFLMVLEVPDDIKYQVGGGSLIIDVEVDIRDEEGWVEDITSFTFSLHATKKTWEEAERDCQREGGHLASVTSDEENEMVSNLVADKKVWLGGSWQGALGSPQLGGSPQWGGVTPVGWAWSDNSTWGYTNWGGDSEDWCIKFEDKK